MGNLIFQVVLVVSLSCLPSSLTPSLPPAFATLGVFTKQRWNFRLPGNCTTSNITRNKVLCPHRFRAPAGLLLLDFCRPESQTAKLQPAYCCRSVLQINHSIWRDHLMSSSCGGGREEGLGQGIYAIKRVMYAVHTHCAESLVREGRCDSRGETLLCVPFLDGGFRFFIDLCSCFAFSLLASPSKSRICR